MDTVWGHYQGESKTLSYIGYLRQKLEETGRNGYTYGQGIDTLKEQVKERDKARKPHNGKQAWKRKG